MYTGVRSVAGQEEEERLPETRAGHVIESGNLGVVCRVRLRLVDGDDRVALRGFRRRVSLMAREKEKEGTETHSQSRVLALEADKVYPCRVFAVVRGKEEREGLDGGKLGGSASGEG